MRDLIETYLVDNWSPGWEIEFDADITEIPIMTDLELFIFFMQAMGISNEER